ncbi:hypothetical protein PYCCODRAFT_1432787 [Trametes coccinea BRFM310]|uniref:DUF6699 domain-containing protein n=1 Tax=Trametes coccinea (strain BRFM310) TaxID=1353009 RepID=A0A1Y2IYJ7_TRAC3|nr:hypothetical protein PYCCODRAFT_1432787 [Trametes coccinea BRFM310]
MDARPKKTVRFASFPARTPSPASSTASDSLSSSPGPSTPPQVYPAYLPPIAQYTVYPPWEPLPPAFHDAPYHSPIRTSSPADGPIVDTLLEVLPSPALPPLLWDVMKHPDHIRLGSAHTPGTPRLVSSDVARCAARSSPKENRLPLRRMVLLLPSIPREIEVTPAKEAVWASAPLPYVTVGDVLHNLYRALRMPVDPKELGRLDLPRRERLRRAFETRLRDDPANRARDLEYGIRRIDYLGNRRAFLGIRPARSSEVPRGERQRDVFIVELGACV